MMILKGSMYSISSPSVKIQINGGKNCLRGKDKTLLGNVNRLLKQNDCLHHPATFCLITSSKLSRSQFEFSLMEKVMGYRLKTFLL